MWVKVYGEDVSSGTSASNERTPPSGPGYRTLASMFRIVASTRRRRMGDSPQTWLRRAPERWIVCPDALPRFSAGK